MVPKETPARWKTIKLLLLEACSVYGKSVALYVVTRHLNPKVESIKEGQINFYKENIWLTVRKK